MVKPYILRFIISVFVLSFVFQSLHSQISTTKVAEEKSELDVEAYDSLTNFLGEEVRKYIGQTLYLVGKKETSRKYGYEGFLKNYKKGDGKFNVYKCCESYNSKYDSLAGRYFEVVEVHEHPKAKDAPYLYGDKFFLELIEKKSGDDLYFKYDSEFDFRFPFLVVGFYEKQKESLVGKKFVFGNYLLDHEGYSSGLDIETGKKVTNTLNQRWECVDLTVDKKYYRLSLIVKNSLGEKASVSIKALEDDSYVRCFTEKEAETYESRFGKNNWLKILDGVVLIGFTEEMVLLSWGKPKKN